MTLFKTEIVKSQEPDLRVFMAYINVIGRKQLLQNFPMVKSLLMDLVKQKYSLNGSKNFDLYELGLF